MNKEEIRDWITNNSFVWDSMVKRDVNLWNLVKDWETNLESEKAAEVVIETISSEKIY